MKHRYKAWKTNLRNGDIAKPDAVADAKSHWIGRLQIVMAAVLWSTSGFFVKSNWFEAWPAEIRGLQIAFWRAAFAILLLLPFVRNCRWHPSLIPMAASFAIMVWSFMTAMVHGPAANAIWLQYLCPAWVSMYGVLMHRKWPDRSESTMMGFCISGVLLILWMEMSSGVNLYATLLGILSGISFAAVVLTMRAQHDMNPVWLITVNHAATIMFLSPWAVSGNSIPAQSYLVLAFFGLIQMSIPYLLFARGLRSVSGVEASLLTLIEPILLPCWVFLIWSNDPSYQPTPLWTKLGATLILIGLLTRYLPPLYQEFRLRRNLAKP